jgi:hypothetical protein
MTLPEWQAELHEAERRFWFVQRLAALEQTDDVLKARLEIQAGLFVHFFCSVASGRVQMALVQGSQRLYGRDRENEQWHTHPFGQADKHIFTAEGLSPRPLMQFLTEVEQLLLANELI